MSADGGPSRVGRVARELIRAYNEHDVETGKALLAPDGEIYGLRYAIEGTVYRGPDGAERFWADLDDVWGRVRTEDQDVLERGDEALVVATLILEGRGSGARTERRIAVHLEVDEHGLVRRFLTLMDPEAALRDWDAGRRPEPG